MANLLKLLGMQPGTCIIRIKTWLLTSVGIRLQVVQPRACNAIGHGLRTFFIFINCVTGSLLVDLREPSSEQRGDISLNSHSNYGLTYKLASQRP